MTWLGSLRALFGSPTADTQRQNRYAGVADRFQASTDAAALPATELAPAEPGIAAHSAKARVLIIDDSPTVIALLNGTLGRAGFEVGAALSAEEGLEIAFAQAFDLIVLDIVLPGMNGFDALRALKRDPRTQAIPVLMISGNKQETDTSYVQRIGAEDFLAKPFTNAELLRKVDEALGRGEHSAASGH